MENILDKVEIRYTLAEDAKPLKAWLEEPGVLRWFPMSSESEIDDAVNRWIYYHRFRCSLTATLEGRAIGLATFYPQAYKKLKHQAQLSIIVSPHHRNLRVGERLMLHLFHLAKSQFAIDLLHLEVYEENPAVSFYKRLGFLEFGRQSHWIQEEGGGARARIFMERFI